MNKPIAVLISDIHFTIATLEQASQSLLKAQFRAKILNIPLIICGDTLDNKAIIRAECSNKLIQLLSVVDAPDTIILVGNHDLCNEKGRDHALNFLKPYATIIETPQQGQISGTEVMLIPYQSDINTIKQILQDKEFPCPKLVIMHQGLVGSDQGHYIQDKSALTKEDVKDFRVISGHYHKRQDIDCDPESKYSFIKYQGIFSYVGNPYTLGFGEANDPEKGFQILFDDGSLEFVPINLRKHVVINTTSAELANPENKQSYPKDAIIWVKLTASTDALNKIDKQEIARLLDINLSFRLDLIPIDTKSELKSIDINESQEQLLDNVIDSLTNTDINRKARLKLLWKQLDGGDK